MYAISAPFATAQIDDNGDAPLKVIDKSEVPPIRNWVGGIIYKDGIANKYTWCKVDEFVSTIYKKLYVCVCCACVVPVLCLCLVLGACTMLACTTYLSVCL